MTDGSINPFTPGYGGQPPYMAGREAEQSTYAEAVDRLAAKAPCGSIVMHGPRGMGKTTMLNWLRVQCRERDLSVITATPDVDGEFPIASLASLLPDGQLTLDKASLQGHLTDACKRNPCALLLDEAHTLGEAPCRGFLNTTQLVMGDAPLLLVLAGTPGLTQFLGGVGAGFIERAEYMSIGRLTAEAATDAISIPLERDGIQVEADMLKQVVEDSHRYPFFLQLWGKALWNVAKEHGLDRLTTDHLPLAAPPVQKERDGFYGQRYSYMEDNDELLAAANAIGKAFTDGVEAVALTKIIDITVASLEGVISDDDQRREKAIALIDELNSIDYIWGPNEPLQMEPGNHGFMTHVMEKS